MPAYLNVPYLSGQSEAQASQQLYALGLQVSVRQQESTEVLPGTVLSVDPPPGTMVGPGVVITLTVAKAPASPSPSITPSSPSPSTMSPSPS
jgi:serine/threonine-protein kinase